MSGVVLIRVFSKQLLKYQFISFSYALLLMYLLHQSLFLYCIVIVVFSNGLWSIYVWWLSSLSKEAKGKRFKHSHKKQKDSLETRAVLLVFSFKLEISGVAVQIIHQQKQPKTVDFVRNCLVKTTLKLF